MVEKRRLEGAEMLMVEVVEKRMVEAAGKMSVAWPKEGSGGSGGSGGGAKNEKKSYGTDYGK